MKQINLSLKIGKIKFNLEFEADESTEREVHDDLFAVADAVMAQQRRLFQSFDQREKAEKATTKKPSRNEYPEEAARQVVRSE